MKTSERNVSFDIEFHNLAHWKENVAHPCTILLKIVRHAQLTKFKNWHTALTRLPTPALGHSMTLEEKYDEIKFALEKISYTQHQCIICVDLKMVGFLLRLHGGYTKFPCFLCLRDSRARTEHWIKKDWPVRSELIPGSLNVLAPPLVERSKIVFPPLHIKLGIMKQFVKTLDKDGGCSKYICMKFPGLTIEKLKAGIFNGPQIRK